VWYRGDEALGVSEGRLFRFEGVAYIGAGARCGMAVGCLDHRPDVAGTRATIFGTSGSDVLEGTPGPDVILGLEGNDVIDGRGGDDLICAGAGDDVASGGIGSDDVHGGTGADVLRGYHGADRVVGHAGRDVIFGGTGHDVLDGGADDDGLYAGAGVDVVMGGGGDDGCFGGPGSDTFEGCRVVGPEGPRYGAEPFTTFDVTIEEGVPVGYEHFVAAIDRYLGDARSWIGDGRTGLKRVAADGAFSIILATPATVDRLCAPLRTGGYYSCRNGRNVVINRDRWLTATAWWPAPLETYRQYVINHEVGHYLGHGHVSCPGTGRLAPVMMQQTKSLDGCIANGWVYPNN
jgi:Ca2+-binding RTX toxin-like protein